MATKKGSASQNPRGKQHFLFRPNSKAFRTFIFNRMAALELAAIARTQEAAS